MHVFQISELGIIGILCLCQLALLGRSRILLRLGCQCCETVDWVIRVRRQQGFNLRLRLCHHGIHHLLNLSVLFRLHPLKCAIELSLTFGKSISDPLLGSDLPIRYLVLEIYDIFPV